MPEDWNSYFCKVNGALASIALDLGLREQVPLPSKPELLWVWIYFNSPRPDGLSSNSEFSTLVAIEKHITKCLQQSFDAIFCGRMTTEGRREVSCYGAHSVEFESIVADALSQFSSYEFEYGTKEDSEWRHYLDVLYPSDEDLQRIKNRSVIEVLEGKGDSLEVPRDILHWIYFRTEADRDAFWAAIQPSGYRLES